MNTHGSLKKIFKKGCQLNEIKIISNNFEIKITVQVKYIKIDILNKKKINNTIMIDSGGLKSHAALRVLCRHWGSLCFP